MLFRSPRGSRLRLLEEQLQLQRKLLGLPYLVSVPIDFLCWHLLFLAEQSAVSLLLGGHLTTDGSLDRPYPCDLPLDDPLE